MPSDELFQSRIRELVRIQGYERQQRLYGVTRRTIRRWEAGETRPSQATRRSVVERGLRASGEPVIRERDARGRFTAGRQIFDPASIRAVRAERSRRRRERLRALQSARTERSRQRAESMPEDVTFDEALDIQRVLLQRFDNVTEQDWIEWRERLADAGYVDQRGRAYRRRDVERLRDVIRVYL